MPPSNRNKDSIDTVSSLLRSAEKKLHEHAVEDAARSSEILLAFVLGKDEVSLIREHEESVSTESADRYRAFVDRRAAHVPVAYLVHQKEFYSLPFYVDENVLIPRPETEILVEQAIQLINAYSPPTPVVCDVGTGSGIISIVVKKHCPKVKMLGLDVSGHALNVAKKNAQSHQVEVKYLQSDLLQALDCQVDFVLANLPYIPKGDVLRLEMDVKDFEPHLALVGGHDGLRLIEDLLKQAKEKLNSSGYVLLEFGFGQVEALESIAKQNCFEVVSVKKDYAGIPRVMVLRKV